MPVLAQDWIQKLAMELSAVRLQLDALRAMVDEADADRMLRESAVDLGFVVTDLQSLIERTAS